MAWSLVAVLIALQLLGLLAIYLALRRHLDRSGDRSAQLGDVRAQVRDLIAELNGAADRSVTLLEDRIRQADELLRELRQDDTPPVHTGPPGDSFAAGAPAGQTPRPGHPRAEPPRSGRETAEPVPLPATAADRQAQVMRLHRLGFSAAAIAERLRTSLGEVELIVNLASKADSPDR